MKIYISKKHDIKINIPIDRDETEMFLRRVIIILSALSVVLAALCIVFGSGIKRCKIEAGDSITASDIVKRDDARFGDDFDPYCTSRVGVYYFTVISRDKETNVRLEVVDTKAPIVTVKNVKCAIGGKYPKPEEFIDTIEEASNYTGEFVTPLPETFYAPGVYSAQVRYRDSEGNKTEVFDVAVELIVDTEAPKVEITSNIVAYVGESISYKQHIRLIDNCVGDIKITVDDSKVDLSVAGEYPVYITAEDSVGNKSKPQEAKVHVYSEEITESKLFDKISGIAAEIIRDNMTAEEKCRAIYDYVYNNIAYVSTSDKTMWQRAAYDALFVMGSGDCFSYFASAKAFLEYLGIENLDIQRTPGFTADTHYWSLVNIGSKDSPMWYHFDCTRLRAEYNHSGCLLTLKQTEAYNKVRDSFYRYDKSKYPTVATEIITPTPELEKYYD